MTAALPLMKYLLTPLVKSVLIPLGLTAAVPATDTTTQKKIIRSETALIILNKETEDIMEIVKSFEESG